AGDRGVAAGRRGGRAGAGEEHHGDAVRLRDERLGPAAATGRVAAVERGGRADEAADGRGPGDAGAAGPVEPDRERDGGDAANAGGTVQITADSPQRHKAHKED